MDKVIYHKFTGEKFSFALSLCGIFLLIYIIFIFIFSSGVPTAVDYIFTTAFTLFVTCPITVNLYFLIPSYLEKGKYKEYAVLVYFIWHLSVLTWEHLYFPALEWLYDSYFFISYQFENNYYLIFFIILIITSIGKLIEDWVKFKSNENKALKLKNIQVETQLNALQAQINPHFLFNSLNVIYAMALEQKNEITDAIVKLSDILRHVLYKSDAHYIILEQEIALLETYIAFHSYRTDNAQIADFKIDIENKEYRLYPMLLLPLLENSFKHSAKKNSEVKEKITLSLYQKQQVLYLSIKNYCQPKTDSTISNDRGIGLKNLQKTLNLVYPNSHILDISTQENTFSVNLKILHEIEPK